MIRVERGRAELGDGCFTRITTALPGCPPLALSARPGSYFLALGRQDVRLDHPGFDDRYIVKTSSIEATRLWLGPAELDAILATYEPEASDPFAATIEVGVLQLIENDGSSQRTDQAIAAAALIGTRGRRLTEAWVERAAVLGGGTRGELWTCDGDLDEDEDVVPPPARAGFAIELTRAGTHISIDFPYRHPSLPGGRLRTRVWAPRAAASVAVDWRAELARHGQADRLDALTAGAGPDWVLVTPELASVGWDAHVDDVDRLSRACDIVELIAGRRSLAGAPYRGG